MKYKTKQLLKMSQDEIFELCDGNCDTKRCLFKKSLRECRQDGFCISQTYEFLDGWIKDDEQEIKALEFDIKNIKERIEKYKKWKGKFEDELRKNK